VLAWDPSDSTQKGPLHWSLENSTKIIKYHEKYMYMRLLGNTKTDDRRSK
jgi:hypothetical protein